MEIRVDSTGSSGSNRIDITKANRDAIREQNPSPPKPEPVKPLSLGDGNASKRIATARDRFDEARSVHVRIEGARDRFDAAVSVHKRIEGARTRTDGTPEDQVSLSMNSQALADTGPRVIDEKARALRVTDLKSQYKSGQLDVGSLVAQTAYRMLGGA